MNGERYIMNTQKKGMTGKDIITVGIFSAIYFVTGQFTVVILIAFAVSCILAELCRICSHYRSFRGNALAYVFFSLGMIGSPLPVWIMRDSFLAQISQQGMPEAYVSTLAALTSPGMIVVLVGAPIVGAILGILLAKGMFRKHFEKAGIL